MPTTLTSRGIARERIINEVARDPIDAVLNDLGLVVEMWGSEIAIASHGPHGSIRGWDGLQAP